MAEEVAVAVDVRPVPPRRPGQKCNACLALGWDRDATLVYPAREDLPEVGLCDFHSAQRDMLVGAYGSPELALIAIEEAP